ncbi:hypothetical protein AKJ51_04850 [candidate division MSBL1 archaeon SCGC-AAA382A20]|uniref:Uncharacterized protein n=1 Tax=candidate division MSBL1 archaeon SCGC-AAA382A20 TaxID=1698280 RepID=A0A133VH45_9EURY|nr:hypothetical protein AKJ51_04850 [candidate division MSBL1 archaeon SCGC-AAA382A20]
MGKKITNNNKLQSSIVKRLSSFFTLVEMLVAVALGVIILGVAVTAFKQGGDVASVSHAKTEAVHNARVALSMVERDLQNAYLEPGGNVFIGTDNSPRDRLELLTLSEQAGVTGYAHVGYYLTNTDGQVLKRYYDTSSTFWPSASKPWNSAPASPEEYVAGFGIQELELRYYYDGYWFREWNSWDTSGYLYNDKNGSVSWESDEEVWSDEDDSGTYNSGDVKVYYGDDGSWDTPTGAKSFDLFYRRLPEVVEVTIEVIDSDGVLAKEQYNPIQIRRLIELPK